MSTSLRVVASIPQDGVVDYTDVSTVSERAMMSAVIQQPVSIDIEIDQYSFQLYSCGVFTASCGSHLDHGVSIGGYRCEAGTGLLESEEFVGKFVG